MSPKLSFAVFRLLAIAAVALSFTSHSMRPIHASCVGCDKMDKCQFISEGYNQCIEYENGECENGGGIC